MSMTWFLGLQHWTADEWSNFVCFTDVLYLPVCMCLQLTDDFGLFVVHYVGGMMIFGFGLIYVWMHVALSFYTVHKLSSMFACWFRVILSVIITLAFIACILPAQTL